MNITITLTLDDEQLSAVTSAANGGDPTQYLNDKVGRMIASWVKIEYDAALRTLGERAAGLSYNARMALIKQVDAALPPVVEPDTSPVVEPTAEPVSVEPTPTAKKKTKSNTP